MLAVTRPVSRSFGQCELEHLARQTIDVELAIRQHAAYERCLTQFGAIIARAPAIPDLPDAVFVEDPALVFNEIAVITRMRSEVRRRESESLAEVLRQYREVAAINGPATLEGGDVLIVGRKVFVGISNRTTVEGAKQLSAILAPFDYAVQTVAVRGCLHIKTACCHLGGDTLLANPDWIDLEPFRGFEILKTPSAEPFASNVIAVGEGVLLPNCFPATRFLLEQRRWKVMPVDISEFHKAEAGLICMSLLFQ
jgi:dimethylargininase